MTLPDAPRRRVNYFEGRLLSADDFRDEQQAGRERSWLHNRMLHGSGVVEGLDVSVDGDVVVVSPGMAIDAVGREIVLTERAGVDGSAVTPDSHGRVHLAVAWDEVPDDEVVGPDGPVPGHYVERPRLALFESGAGGPDSAGVVLARVHRAGAVLVADGSVRRHVRRSGHGDR
ncbi:hypothetical protein GCM10009868_26160 [Terrabacter aerolatus]|uniref:Uncharacterized protein n=1 Tax=Terrabacter aerolatus TaxID=422442 RepID=A0A512D570_9MICO|nr:hypothetical protein [Terrabacter aerolatus]GEO31623.1 hypothetical protein TAE01_34330 [Terrabacter aerolatus]